MISADAGASLTRRGFLGHAAAAAAGLVGPRVVKAQSVTPAPNAGVDSSNLFAMDQTASRPVRLPPKPGARPSMTAAARDALEHQLRCQCGCTLDIYTCRTTDFACRVSPAMHRDVMYLVEGGYSADEIVDAFVRVYGEKALMAPTKEGFNLLGWAAPFLVVAGGAVGLLALIRNWRRAPDPARAPLRVSTDLPVRRPLEATDEELARLRAEVRDDA